MEAFYKLCRKHHLKITPQRTAVYKLLTASSAHPSADQIHKTLKKDFPNISLDTVNRTLITFAGAGMIRVVEGHGDPRRFDPNVDDHHHFYCLSCRGIFDFHDKALDKITVSSETRDRFTITGKRVCLTGYCKACSGQPG
jgi:Fur family peroxide stress response transcriptional regulator